MALSVGDASSRLGQLSAPIIQTIDAPGGGTWAMAADGGVFSLDGAPFFGSYPGLPPEGRLGQRSFVFMQRNNSGGYTLISNHGETYNFDAPAGQATPAAPAPPPPSAPPPASAGPAGLTSDQMSAKGVLNKILADAGLSGMGDWLWGHYLEVGEGQALLDLRERPEYQQRFPAMKFLSGQGRAITEAEYISYEKTASSLFRQFGLPETFYDQASDFQSFLESGVSTSELANRIQTASQMAFSAPVETRQALQDLYGVTAGGLTAYWLDPDKALPVLERQALAAQTAGVATRTGYGTLTREEAERLADLGISGQQAQAGFGDLVRNKELMGGLPGERGAATLSKDQQLAATFEGNEAEAEKIRKAARRRLAQFSGGGQFVTGSEGVSGLAQS